jgi:hypothetical protein
LMTSPFAHPSIAAANGLPHLFFLSSRNTSLVRFSFLHLDAQQNCGRVSC